MLFDWMSDPHAWVGLATLIVLEIVLGVDNLVFIAILAEKLPSHQRNKARVLGLGCALLMRLILLYFIAHIMALKDPWFTVFGHPFSIRDIIMLIGGVFLLAKGTMELHERLEGVDHSEGKGLKHAVFWQVIVQIVVLDAIFSLDSIITAVGMMKEEYVIVMMIAVIVAMGVMLLASKVLMDFVSRHPTVVILCLGFLMMIGFSLVVEGFGFHIPKGYLYAAIGFSIMIEAFNQIGRHNREKSVSTYDLRERTAGAVLRLLGGGKTDDSSLGETVDLIAEQSAASEIFRPEEKEMIRGVLDLADRPVRSIMTPRNEIEWLDLTVDQDEMITELKSFKHSRIILARGKVDEFVGVALTKDLLLNLVEKEKIDWQKAMRQPLVVHENTNVLPLMEQLRLSPVQLAIIVDEHGSFEGIATPTDILEAIAGDFPDDDDDQLILEHHEDGSLIVEGFADIRRLSGILNRDLVDESDRYTTLAGYMLWHFGHLPVQGESFEADGFRFEVMVMERRNIGKVHIVPLITEKDE